MRHRRLALLALAALLFATSAGAAAPLRLAILADDGTTLRRQLDLGGFDVVGVDAAPAVVLIADAAPSAEQAAAIRAAVEEGAGLVLILGPRLDEEAVRDLLGDGVHTAVRDAPAIVTAAAEHPSAIARRIPWRSAPQVGERTRIDGAGLTPLVVTRDDEAVIAEARRGRGRVLVVTPWLASTSPASPGAANYQFQTWSYFPYLLYALVVEASGAAPPAFEEWPQAPLPTREERAALALFFAGLLAVTTVTFLLVRRYSRRHPEALDRFVELNFARHDLAAAEQTGWDEVGFHRPLGGFLIFLVATLFVGAPLLLGYSILFRNVVFPFPHALGLWQWVKQFFQFLFTFLDLGTSVALVKYFAELRIHDPRRGMQYIQFYVWWQALSGVAQVALVSGAAVYALPGTDYAALCYVVLGHALIQLPGFLLLFHHVFSAMQRFDLAQLMTLLVPFVPLPLALFSVRFMRDWGFERPRFGEAVGSIFGLAISDYLGILSLFVLGLILFRAVYKSSSALFLAHFDRTVATTALSFGFRAALSGVAVGLSAMAQTVILAETVDNYSELQGIWGFGWETILVYIAVAVMLCENVRAAVSESFNNGKTQLTHYYLTAAVRWGVLIALVLWGVQSVSWSWLVAGIYGEQWIRTLDYLWLFHLIGVMHVLAMLPTPFLQACGRPGLDAVTVWLEHSCLVVLLYHLTPEFQLWGMLYARAGALLFARILPAWWLLRRYAARPPLYPWQCVVAPLATGLALMACYRLAGWIFWDGTSTTTVVLAIAGIVLGTPFGLFLSGIFGGWDDRGLAETDKAIALTRFVRPLAALLHRATELGCRLSPLHGRFPILLGAAADREAEELAGERRETARRLLAAEAAAP